MKCESGCCRPTQCPEMSTEQCKKMTGGLVVRLLYLSYAIVSIVVRTAVFIKTKNDGLNVFTIVLLCLGIPFMIAETVYISVIRKGRELKWFTPNVLFFGIAALPSIINLQFHLDKHKDCASGNTTLTSPTFHFETDEWTVLLIQIAIILLVIGKWISPKSSLSSEKHAQLALAVLCTGADIVDLIGTEFDGVRKDYDCVMRHVVMFFGVWGALQFCFVPTAVKKTPAGAIEAAFVGQSQVSIAGEHGIPHTLQAVPGNRSKFPCFDRWFCFYNDTYGMIINLIFIDVPFMIVRLILICARYVKVDHNHFFFAFKNAFSIFIAIYRIWMIRKLEYRKWRAQMGDTNIRQG